MISYKRLHYFDGKVTKKFSVPHMKFNFFL